ncbi:MAG: DMT family transporter [Rhodospirillaceae bacterium]|nr:DMT family transporter [Rhodospirillaceae bacterium]
MVVTKGAPIRRFWHSLSPNGRGAVYILTGSLFFAMQAAGLKEVTQRLDVLQVVFLRSALLALFILPAAMARGGIATARPMAHLGRGVLGLAGFLCMVFAIANAPLADVTALTFTKQLFMVPLAIVLLGEIVGWRRWTAVAVGFAGVLVMVRPGGAPFDLALAAALANGLLTAFIAIVLKQLARTERPETMVFYFGFFSALLMAAPAAFVWTWPSAADWAVLVVAALLGTIGQSCTVRGWAIGEASAMAPMGYVYLIHVALLGYFVFGELPTLWTVLGSIIIIAATLYIALHEARGARRPARRPSSAPAAAE